MPPTTRSNRETTPPNPIQSHEADTVKKTRFFSLYDERKNYDSLRSISKSVGITHSCASRWLQQRDTLGSPAYRHTRKLAVRLGRPPKVSKEQCQMLVSPSQNPVRNQLYEAQIQYHKLDSSKRTIQRRLKQCTNGGQRYKQAYVQKVISKKNKGLRVEYGIQHQDKTIEDFWQYVYFTDEAHIDPSSMSQGNILRERGHRYDVENIQERPEKVGVKLHVAGWINWHSKAPKLEFYNDENDYIQRPKKPPKPKKSKYESDTEYETRVLEWEASIPHDQVVKPKGNAMTQKYYTERLLPLYIDAIHKARLWNPQNWLLQEDNDPSHGTKKKGLAQQLKTLNWIESLVHPAQSPDLNPMEAIWNIIKQRLRYKVWKDLKELKQALQEEWAKVTMEEVHARISEMPERCRLLVKSGGGPIKSELW